MKIQPQSFLGSGEELQVFFLPIMGKAAIMFSGVELFEQIVSILLTGPMWNLVKIGQAISEKIMFLYMYKNIYNPGARAVNAGRM